MGNMTYYKFDGAGRKIAQIQDDQITYFEYDTLGRLWKTKKDDKITIKEYDYLENLLEERVEDSSGTIFQKTQYAYDISGNCISEKVYVDTQNYSEKQTVYNSENLPVQKIDPEGNQTEILYHYSDHLEKEIIDPLERRTLEIYDCLHRVSTVEKYAANGQLLSHRSYAYDGRGYTLQQSDWNLLEDEQYGVHEVCNVFDEMGQKISETEQGQKKTSYTYQKGRLHTITKPGDIVLTHIHDAVGCLKELYSSDETIHYSYAYNRNDDSNSR